VKQKHKALLFRRKEACGHLTALFKRSGNPKRPDYTTDERIVLLRVKSAFHRLFLEAWKKMIDPQGSTLSQESEYTKVS
jgi:hypothetical protein